MTLEGLNIACRSNLAGVYMITCIAEGKVYVGSSNNLYSRFSDHKGSLRRNQHHNAYLQNAWNKHGESNFVFSILQYCERERNAIIRLEQWYLSAFSPYNPDIGYNLSPTAGSVFGIKKSEEETKAIQLRYIGWKHEGQALKNIQEAQAKFRKDFTIVSPDGVTYTAKGIMAFAAAHNLCRVGLSAVLRKENVHTAGWHLPETKGPFHIKSVYVGIMRFINPRGELTEVDSKDLVRFCDIHSLRNDRLRDVWRGDCKIHRGWKRANLIVEEIAA